MPSARPATMILAPFGLALLCASAVSAQESQGASTPGVFREADSSMSCAQIGDEAATLSQTMGDETPVGGWLSALGGLARSGAALLVPGGGLAVAGVDAATRSGRDRNEAERLQTLNRWYYLNGLHAGRGCREQAAAAAVPAPAPSPAIQPATLNVAVGTR